MRVVFDPDKDIVVATGWSIVIKLGGKEGIRFDFFMPTGQTSEVLGSVGPHWHYVTDGRGHLDPGKPEDLPLNVNPRSLVIKHLQRGLLAAALESGRKEMIANVDFLRAQTDLTPQLEQRLPEELVAVS